MKTWLLLFFLAAGLTIDVLRAQSPTPLIIQAASPASASSQPRTNTGAPGDPKRMIETLQEMRETNNLTLKKQEAALLTLDELQKAAEELKIFSKRG
ncbi:MAG TPA: hypothetical protein VFJ88_05450 [Chthoniobacterales bacterium]|nr:hypothetical protein [Chthoniobacterales bacterium]